MKNKNKKKEEMMKEQEVLGRTNRLLSFHSILSI
jgi:hypothetical protein